MPQRVFAVTLLGVFVLSSQLSLGAESPASVSIAAVGDFPGVLWQNPKDIRSRNLYYGAGGKADQPRQPFTFKEEDTSGTNPKFVVEDRDGTKWTVKLGIEAKPETAATRLVWAAGYFTNEDYFLPEIHVKGMPAHLKRGANLVGPGGRIKNARLKRHLPGEKTIGLWDWRHGPFAHTRELNGLRVMMALMNNWDLKTPNNKIYSRGDHKQPIYMVSDLGASFGPSGISLPLSHSRGDIRKYENSTFIRYVRGDDVDFRTPRPPYLITALWPFSYLPRARVDHSLRHIPRGDAHWIGTLLSRLSASQIHDAFRAADYRPEDIDAYSGIVEKRIAQLKAL